MSTHGRAMLRCRASGSEDPPVHCHHGCLQICGLPLDPACCTPRGCHHVKQEKGSGCIFKRNIREEKNSVFQSSQVAVKQLLLSMAVAVAQRPLQTCSCQGLKGKIPASQSPNSSNKSLQFLCFHKDMACCRVTWKRHHSALSAHSPHCRS